MQKYIDLACKLNVKLQIITCTANFGNIHNVPEEVVQRMKQNFEV